MTKSNLRGPLLVGAIAAASLLAAAAPAAAEDFTFEVPLEFTRMPGLEEVTIRCLVSRRESAEGGGRASASEVDVIASHSVVQRIVRGAFAGDVTVAMNATPGRRASDGRFYSCFIYQAHFRLSDGARADASTGNFRRVYEDFTGNRVTAYEYIAFGPIRR